MRSHNPSLSTINSIISSVGFRRQSGFTLIEVMVALMIVSVGVVAVIDATNKYTFAQSELEKKVLAEWVGSNALDKARFEALTGGVKQGSQRETVSMGAHKWRTRLSKEATDVEGVFKVTVEVTLDGDASKRVISTLTTAMTESR
jgi:general secretion pathway protein I